MHVTQKYNVMQQGADTSRAKGANDANDSDTNGANGAQASNVDKTHIVPLFYQVQWRDARRNDPKTGVKGMMRSINMVRHVPDKPLVAGGVTGFEMAEYMTRSLIVKDLREHLKDDVACDRLGNPDMSTAATPQDILCCAPSCDKMADGAVVWYPFDPSTWDGCSDPQVKEAMPPLEYIDGTACRDRRARERVTVGIPVMAWCARTAKCKAEMLAYMLQRYQPVVQQHDLVGGHIYCWQCGKMEKTDFAALPDREIKVHKGRGAWCKQCDRPATGCRQICTSFGRVLQK